MTLLETLPGVHRWCCTWCGREADRDEPCCEERMPAYEAAARSLWPVYASLPDLSRAPYLDRAKAAVDAALAELEL